jgi:hypothetical protein
MNHDVRLSDVGLDNPWYSFDRRPDRCHRETPQKMMQKFPKDCSTLEITPIVEGGNRRRGGDIHEDND